MAFCKMQINMHIKTAHHILKNEVDLILPKFPEGRKTNKGIFSMIISGFVGLAFQGISSFYTIEDIKLCIKQYVPCHLKQIYKETNLCI